jgi:mannose-6-phosphate isomerase-like protein (cupin superfamily)
MKYFVDIDGTICNTDSSCADTMTKYKNATPILERISEVNKLYDAGNTITYWTARGGHSGLDLQDLTKEQLSLWGCKYHYILFGKPSYDLYIDDKSQNVDSFWPLTPNSMIKKTSPSFVKKGWGHEKIIINNSQYCGKILHFNTGAKFSMHFHIKKIETWYVASGLFVFKWINTHNADLIEETLSPGDVITNNIGEPHQIICKEEGDIFEVSTTHFDSDSYRVAKGDSQNIA